MTFALIDYSACRGSNSELPLTQSVLAGGWTRATVNSLQLDTDLCNQRINLRFHGCEFCFRCRDCARCQLLGVVENDIRQSISRPTAVRGKVAAGGRVRVSQAPTPTGTDLAAGASAPRPKSLDNPRLSQKDYNRMRDEQDIARHGYVRR